MKTPMSPMVTCSMLARAGLAAAAYETACESVCVHM